MAAREMTNEAWSNDALTNAAAAAGQCVGSAGQRLGNMDMWSCINGENMTIEDKDESETLMRMLEKEEELKVFRPIHRLHLRSSPPTCRIESGMTHI